MMRLYIKPEASSVLRVQAFIDACNETIETIEIAEPRSGEFRKINPFGTVPVLETPSGDIITESLTICRFLNEHWGAGLFGNNDETRLAVDQWDRRAELLFLIPGIEFVHQTHPMFARRMIQNPLWAQAIVVRAAEAIKPFEDRLSTSSFLAGGEFTIADITFFIGIGAFALPGGLDLDRFPGIQRWREYTSSLFAMQRLRQVGL